MKTSNRLTIAYIGGGSQGWAWNLMVDLALEDQLSGTVRLYDIDHEAAARNAQIGNLLKLRPEVKGHWDYAAVPNLQQALSGADFVICSILPGTFKNMASDVHEPERYGLYQSVGDTVGPGGLLRALRTIPMYVEIGEAISRWAPRAWVINYTNPMSLCTRTLYEVFPEIKAFGCCHEVFGTQKLLAAMVAESRGIEGVDRAAIKVNVLGINHFTWLDRANYQGEDLFPLYRHYAQQHRETGFAPGEEDHWLNSHFASRNRVKFDLFLRYGLIAAAGDRHLAEFLPLWYLKDPETVKSYKFSLTPVSWRVGRKSELQAQSLRLSRGEEAMELKSSGEEGILQIKALLGMADLVTNVNLPNQGQCPDLPLGTVVETNALFGADDIRPVLAGRLPSEVRALISPHVDNQETILRAALTKDAGLAFQAFLNEPSMTLVPQQAQELFTTMLEKTKDHLPGWKW